ncbi:MAG: phosphate ABC transporter permease PstA [Tissierellia bacterium]|nr:phosphate ABC transporter permease PstA [Tissierellia bacterium]
MGSKVMRAIIKLSAFVTIGTLVLIILYLAFRGIPNLTPELFKWEYNSDNVSMMRSIVSTFIVVILSLLIATPIGVFTGFYLVEYAKKGSKVVDVIRLATETLAGIPSIIYGLFGMLFFSITLHLGFSILSGVFTLSIMVLPLIIRSTEEALIAVDDSLRHGSFALGAGKLRTIFRVVLPVAVPGILSGIILAIGRSVGETAALIFTLGTATDAPKSLLGSSRTLALHMYMLSTEGLYVDQAFATGFVLILVTLIINGISTFISHKFVEGEEA